MCNDPTYTVWTDPLRGAPPSVKIGGTYGTYRDALAAGIALEVTHGPCIIRHGGRFVGVIGHAPAEKIRVRKDPRR
jgi:hypothetical protein